MPEQVPLTADEIRVLIVLRIFAMCDSCNSHHITHVSGQVRALVSVLNGGAKPPSSDDATDFLSAAGVPFSVEGNGFDIPDDWLIERGCTVDGDEVSHPKFGGW